MNSTTSTTTTLVAIKPFKGQNFSQWKFRVSLLLEKHKLLDLVKGIEQKPHSADREKASEVEEKEIDEWIAKDIDAREILVRYIADTHLPEVQDLPSASAMWNALCSRYEGASTASKAFLLRKLISLRMGEGSSVGDHLNAASELASKLAALKAPVPEEYLVVFILNSLPTSWENFITIQEDNDLLTLEKLKAKLLQQELKRKETDTVPDQALYLKNQSRHGNPKTPKLQQPPSGSATTWCSFCKVFCKHTADVCHKKKAAEAKKGKSSNSTPTAHAFMLSGRPRVADDVDWFVDSAATAHMSCQREYFDSFTPEDSTVFLGDNSAIKVTGKGTVRLRMILSAGKELICHLEGVLYVPGLRKNLFSVAKATKRDCFITYSASECNIYTASTKKLLGRAIQHDGLYRLFCLTLQPGTNQVCVVESVAIQARQNNLDLLHRRLGHIGIERLKSLATSQRLLSPQHLSEPLHFCPGCAKGKQHRLKIGRSTVPSASLPLELVTSDICGPFPPSISGFKFFCTFNDSFSRRTVVAFLKHKSEVLSKFKVFHLGTTKETGLPLLQFRSDCGGEYTSKAFINYLQANGIRRQTTDPGTPQQNSLAERKGGILVMMASCMLHHAKLPQTFWAEAVSLACYIANRAPTKVLGRYSPEELWTGRLASLANIRVFGCRAYAVDQRPSRRKLDSRTVECIYLGPSLTSSGHRLYNFNTKRVFISRNVQFDETILGLPDEPSETPLEWDFYTPSMPVPPRRPSASTSQLNSPNLASQDFFELAGDDFAEAVPDNTSADQNCESETLSSEEDPVTSTTVKGKEKEPQQAMPDSSTEHSADSSDNPEHVNDMLPAELPDATTMDSAESPESTESLQPTETTELPSRRVSSRHKTSKKYIIPDEYFCNVSQVPSSSAEPSTYQQAIASPNATEWMLAMQQEIDSLHRNNTWTLVPLPKGRKAIQSRWVFKVKTHADGSHDRFKARHVAKGYTQQHGVDFEETFAPVARFTSLRCIIAIAAAEDLELHLMDVDTAFLYGTLKEEIYVTQPIGFNDPAKPDHVCRLNKSLYGLKQAPRVWNETLDAFLSSAGFKKCTSDPCIYIFLSSKGIVYISVYVDDLLIASSASLLAWVKQLLHRRFRMKDLGEAKSILNIEVIRNRAEGTITLKQSGYIKSILSYFNMQDCKSISTPLEVNASLPQLAETPSSAKAIPFRQAVGKLIYAASATRPDIAFATSFVSRHLQAYDEHHWQAVKRIFRYLQGTLDYGLIYHRATNPPLLLEAYADSDWAGDIKDRKSTSGFIFLLNSSPISWHSKKQATVALSSTEAEYHATTQAAKEAIWLRNLLTELQHPQSAPTIIREDNQGCIALSKNPVFHSRTKHLDIQAHFIREQCRTAQVQLVYCPTQDNIADFLTKALHRPQLLILCQHAGLLTATAQNSE